MDKSRMTMIARLAAMMATGIWGASSAKAAPPACIDKGPFVVLQNQQRVSLPMSVKGRERGLYLECHRPVAAESTLPSELTPATLIRNIATHFECASCSRARAKPVL
jgi:hypothetical protein